MNENLTQIKESIISLGIKKSELQQIMDDIFEEKKLGKSCDQCSEQTNIQHFKEDGFIIHSCSKCPYCILEFNFSITSKKQKNALGPDDGLHLRGKREGKIDEYLQFVCRVNQTIELRSKDIANIKIPFYFSGPLSKRKSANEEALCNLLSRFSELTQDINKFNNAHEKEFHHLYFEDAPIIREDGFIDRVSVSLEGGDPKLHIFPNGIWDDEYEAKYKAEIDKINLLKKKATESFNDEIEKLNFFDLSALTKMKEKSEDVPCFLIEGTIITNVNTNIEYNLKPSDILHTKVFEICKSKFSR